MIQSRLGARAGSRRDVTRSTSKRVRYSAKQELAQSHRSRMGMSPVPWRLRHAYDAPTQHAYVATMPQCCTRPMWPVEARRAPFSLDWSVINGSHHEVLPGGDRAKCAGTLGVVATDQDVVDAGALVASVLHPRPGRVPTGTK